MAETTQSLPERRAEVRRALAEGRVFAAYDLACHALTRWPGNDELHLLAALALVRSGALERAREELQALEARAGATTPIEPRSEAGHLLAAIREELWQAGGKREDLERALALRLERSRARGGFPDAARAALLAQAAGQQDRARALARAALAQTPDERDTNQSLALVELSLLLGEREGAERALEELANQLVDLPVERARARRRLSDLAGQGVPVEPALLERLPPPELIIYAGPQVSAAFTPALEEALLAEISRVLDELRPAIAYGSAAPGCDLLFTEALLARGSELNLVLPYEQADFRRHAAVAGETWLERFDRATDSAATLSEVCLENYTGDDQILRFGNRVIDGTARLRGAALASPPTLVAVWDYLAEPSPGSPSDFIDAWGDPARLRLIDLDEVSSATGGAVPAEAACSVRPAPEEPAEPGVGRQRIAGLLFADVVGFTRLRDAELPLFWRFMQAVAAHMAGDEIRPRLADSWGDALLGVHDTALAAAEHAAALHGAFSGLDSRHFGLPDRLQLRIALHAGPVFEGENPLTKQTVVYGGNVNRAARIEPITVPGRIYASQQFVATLTAEESAAEAETSLTGQSYRPRFRCLYRGMLELPKGYGSQAVYEVQPWQAYPEDRGVLAPGERLSMRLANELGEHRRLAERFSELTAPLALGPDVLSAFEVAFDEIVTNICTYAWADRARHTIEVEIAIEDGVVRASFSDDGAPFDPLEAPEATVEEELEERLVGGLGIHLVRGMMDDVVYRREDGRNRMTIVKRVVPAASN